MNSLKTTKKILLSIAAAIALAVPLLAGLAVQKTAVAQENAREGEATSVEELVEQLRAAGANSSDEYLPIVKVAPIYPQQAAEQGLEGYVIVQYTVNTNGSTEDVVVIESSSPLFDRSAVDSAAKYKYRPRVDDGTPVAVPGVKTKIIYEMAGDPPAQPAPAPTAE